MNLVSRSDDNLEDYLEKLTDNQLWSSSLYSKNSLGYYYQLSADAGKVIEDQSFLLMRTLTLNQYDTAQVQIFGNLWVYPLLLVVIFSYELGNYYLTS